MGVIIIIPFKSHQFTYYLFKEEDKEDKNVILNEIAWEQIGKSEWLNGLPIKFMYPLVLQKWTLFLTLTHISWYRYIMN